MERIDALLFPVWDRVAGEIDLAVTPGGRVGDASPLGHKGGKRRLDDYVRMVSHALMRKGFTKSHAIATAKNSLKRWASGRGKVRPQVRAGAAAHLGIQAGLDKSSRVRSLSVPAPASSQDGPRVTMGGMAKMRAGSIPSGKGKGKYPITKQRDVRAAAALLGKAKGVSKQKVIAHVRAEAAKRGLKLTPAFKQGTKNLTDRAALEGAIAARAKQLDLSIGAEPGSFESNLERRLAVAQEIAARRQAAS